MVRLLLVLCAGLLLTMLIAGRDQGQARMGLTGAYDSAHFQPLARPAETAAARIEPAPTRSAVTAPTAAAGATTIAFSPPPEPQRLQGGLTLALPLVTAAPAADPVVTPVQTGDADADPLARTALPIGYVIGSNVNVREAPSAKAAVMERLSRGEAVTVLGEAAPGWSVIRIEGDGLEGYIASRYLATSPPDGALFSNSD